MPWSATFEAHTPRSGWRWTINLAGTWNVQRDYQEARPVEKVSVAVAPTVAAEAATIRDRIFGLRERGAPFADQVILEPTDIQD